MSPHELPAPIRRPRLFHAQGAAVLGVTVAVYGLVLVLWLLPDFPLADYLQYRLLSLLNPTHWSHPWVADVERRYPFAWMGAGCVVAGVLAGVAFYRATRCQQERPVINRGQAIDSRALHHSLRKNHER